MEYARLYWSLGALEHALTIYDEFDMFLVDIINEMCDVEGEGFATVILFTVQIAVQSY